MRGHLATQERGAIPWITRARKVTRTHVTHRLCFPLDLATAPQGSNKFSLKTSFFQTGGTRGRARREGKSSKAAAILSKNKDCCLEDDGTPSVRRSCHLALDGIAASAGPFTPFYQVPDARRPVSLSATCGFSFTAKSPLTRSLRDSRG